MGNIESNVDVKSYLQASGIRPTKIRLSIGALLFDGMDKHVTVDDVIDMARVSKIKTSVASVYNTLNQFASAGLLRRITVEQGKAFFDTNLSAHHHFFYEDEDRLEDIPVGTIKVEGLPELPIGRKVRAIEVTVRI